jgi:predicted DNA-binding antitoxin AbrB/MazE fold protein
MQAIRLRYEKGQFVPLDPLPALEEGYEITLTLEEGPIYNLLDLAGLGQEIWIGIDAQDYVKQLRDDWDHS